MSAHELGLRVMARILEMSHTDIRSPRISQYPRFHVRFIGMRGGKKGEGLYLPLLNPYFQQSELFQSQVIY